MPLVWSDELVSGIKEIDDQHKEIFRRINELQDAAKEGRGREYIKELVDFLDDYVATHFSAEEGLMKKYNYPMAELHINQHRYLTRRFEEIKEELSTGHKLIATIMAHSVLGMWWVEHILKIDKPLVAYIREKISEGG